MKPTIVQRKITADELMKMPDNGHTYELVDGALVEKPCGMRVGLIAGNFLEALFEKVDGCVFPGSLGYRCFAADPKRVRFPDVSYLRRHQWNPHQDDDREYSPSVPAFVVEIISHDTLCSYLHLKIEHWIEAGVELVMVANPFLKQITAWKKNIGKVYKESDIVTFEPVLPEFSIRVSELFKLAFIE